MKKALSTLLALVMLLGLGSIAKTEALPAGTFTPGTYEGTANGFGGALTVDVTLSSDFIESVEVAEQAETVGIGDKAIEMLPDAIVAAQSTQVDTVTGATVTSQAIIDATNAALAVAGVDPASLIPIAQEKSGVKEDIELSADIVVIGAGGAGMTAAIVAAGEGRSVILLEKEAMSGGNTTRSTGGMNATGTSYQDELEFTEGAGVEKTISDARANYGDALGDLIDTVEQQYSDYLANPEGYFDTVELFMLDTLVGGRNINNHTLVQVLTSQSADGIAWLSEIGADLTSVGSFGGASVKRIHRPVNAEGRTVAVGSYLVPILTQNVDDLDLIDIHYGTPATGLIYEDGAVTGVIASSATAEYTITARAVVIATGGFGANAEMYTAYQPNLEGFVTTNAPGATGDGIIMAQAIGAATVDMEQIQIHPTVEQSTSALITEGLRGDGAILVNANGERFVDEVGTRDVVSAAEIAQPGSFAWLVIDQKMVDASSVIAGYITQGLTVQGDTYEALAGAMEVDPVTFAATMASWNTSVEAKQDDAFGRTSFANALDAAPYYAIRVAPGVHHTMGGLRINESTEVLSADGAPIPGLYAAGEVTGGIHGANRLGGNAVADIIVFGRIAGATAAEYVK